MKKLIKKLRKGRNGFKNDILRKGDFEGYEFNPPNPPPQPLPHPSPDGKGLSQNSKAQRQSEDVGTFTGFGSWMASLEPDPIAQGVVELPVSAQTAVSEVLSLEEGMFWKCSRVHQRTYLFLV